MKFCVVYKTELPEDMFNGGFMKSLSNENVIHKRSGEIEYLQFKKLLQYEDKLTHCFTLKSLDFGHNANYYDNETLFLKNYKKITENLKLNSNNIVRPLQTHTNCVKNIYSEKGIFLDELNEVDGLLTNQKNEILSLTFADCTPILLYDPVKNVIGNVHSGWKGTVNKIGKVAVEKMINDYDSKPENIICCIGPTIRKCHFEVDEDVKDMFEEAFKNSEIINLGEKKQEKQKYFINTVLANMTIMKELGLKDENIIDSKICSVCENEMIHSYRFERENAGRNTALMALI